MPSSQSERRSGVELIAVERQRQVEGEGWTEGHDNSHVDGELAKAAAAYAWPGDMDSRDGRRVHRSVLWPWEDGWSPGDRVRELTKAGALIAAEIDRIERARAAGGS